MAEESEEPVRDRNGRELQRNFVRGEIEMGKSCGSEIQVEGERKEEEEAVT